MSLFAPPECFETNQMLARPLNVTDAPEVFNNLLSDPRVTHHLALATHSCIEQTIAYIRLCQTGWQAGFLHIWGLFDKASGCIVALVEMRAHLPRVEIGLITMQQEGPKKRRALANIAFQMLDWLTTQSNVYRLYSSCDAHSDAARVIQHFGFKYEAQLAQWEARPTQNNPAKDVSIYALVRPFDEWLNAPLRHQLLKKRG